MARRLLQNYCLAVDRRTFGELHNHFLFLYSISCYCRRYSPNKPPGRTEKKFGERSDRGWTVEPQSLFTMCLSALEPKEITIKSAVATI